MNLFNDYVKDEYKWLNADRAKKITTILKKHNGDVKRVAQERGALRVCKLLVTFHAHSWKAAADLQRLARKEVIENGLTNSLTF